MTATAPTDPSLREARLLRVAELARDDLITFTRFCDPRYVPDPLHRYLGRVLQDVRARKLKRVIIAIPPRHGKSRLASIEFPAWCLGHNPHETVITASYSSTLSALNSKEAKKRMTCPEYQLVFPGVGLNRNDAASNDWATTKGGRYKAVGVGGDITGRGASLLIVDDPHASAEEARSKTMREKVWNWYLSDAYSRLAPDGVVVIISTRWHTDDLVGRLTDKDRTRKMEAEGVTGEEWHHINLPAIANDDDPIGRQPGEALSPSRYPLERLQQIKAVVTSYIWSSLYEGNPVPEGGSYIKTGQIETILPDEVPPDLRWHRFWDLATTSKTSSDWTAGPKCAMDEDGNLIIGDITRGRWDWPQARGVIADIATRERILLGVEAVAGFRTSFDNLREVLPDDVALKDYTPAKDKLTRALPWITLASKGKVKIVAGEWNQDFLDEAAKFSGIPSDVDDQIDGVSGCYEMIVNTPKFFLA